MNNITIQNDDIVYFILLKLDVFQFFCHYSYSFFFFLLLSIHEILNPSISYIYEQMWDKNHSSIRSRKNIK